MASSFANVIIHIVFSTKHRFPWLTPSVAADLHRYLSGVAAKLGCPALEVGGPDDHVHLLPVLSRTLTIARLVQDLKTGSSAWIKTQSPELACFQWQNGYGAFSVSGADCEAVRRYIRRQPERHRRQTFVDEMRELTLRAGLEWDEQRLSD